MKGVKLSPKKGLILGKFGRTDQDYLVLFGIWYYLVSIKRFFVPRMRDFYRGSADQYWFSDVVSNLGLPVFTEFPFLMMFPLHNFQKWDCPCILGHTLGIGLLLLMSNTL